METPLQAKKVAILERLLKKGSVTLEEALVLLMPTVQEVTSENPPTVSTYSGAATDYTYHSTSSDARSYVYMITEFID